MKTIRFYKILLFLLYPLVGYSQYGSLIKPDSINLCVLKVDYSTYKFQGGNLSYYKERNYTGALPFVFRYESPIDFGNITIKIKGDTIFDGSIIWMGTGEIKYPKKFTLDSPFNFINTKVKKPMNIEYFYVNGSKLNYGSQFRPLMDSAWEAISRLYITNVFAQSDFKVGIYFYPPTQGMFEASVASWIVFLYYNDYNSSFNDYFGEPATHLNNYSCSIKNSILNTKTEFYPNPTKKEIAIKSNQNIVGSTYTITDLLGRKLLHGTITSQTDRIDINQLKAGMYFIQVGDSCKQRFLKME